MLENKNTLICNPIVWLFKFLFLTWGSVAFLYYVLLGNVGWEMTLPFIKGYFVIFMIFYTPSRFITYTWRWSRVCKQIRIAKKNIKEDILNIDTSLQRELKRHDQHIKNIMEKRRSALSILFSSGIVYCSFFLFLFWVLAMVIVVDRYNLPQSHKLNMIYIWGFWYIPMTCLCYVYDKSVYLATINETMHHFEKRYMIIIKKKQHNINTT